MLSFFAPDVLPREALAKEPSNKDFKKTGGLFKPGFLFDGVYKPSVICKKLPLPGGMPIEVDMAVLPEKILAQGINSEVVSIKDNTKSAPLFLRSVEIKSENLGGAKRAKRLEFCKKWSGFLVPQ